MTFALLSLMATDLHQLLSFDQGCITYQRKCATKQDFMVSVSCIVFRVLEYHTF